MNAESFHQIEAARAEEFIERARNHVSPDYPAHEDDIVSESYLEAVRILEKLAADNPQEYELRLADSLEYLGRTYGFARRFDEELSALLRAVAIWDRTPESASFRISDHVRTYERIAFHYHSLLTLPEEALLYLMRALSLREARIPEAETNSERLDRTRALIPVLNDLAGIHRKSGRYEEAELLYLRSIALSQDCGLGNNAHTRKLGDALFGLALLYHDTDSYFDAEPVYKELIELLEGAAAEKPGLYERDLALALNNYGSLLITVGRYDEAEPFYQRALAIRERHMLESPRLAIEKNRVSTQLYRFGLLYEKTCRTDEAAEAWRRALDIWNGMSENDIDINILDLTNAKMAEMMGD